MNAPIEQLLDGWVHLDAENLVSRLALALRQLIAAGLLAPGEQLPSERLMARALRVSGRTSFPRSPSELPCRPQPTVGSAR